MTDIRHVKCCIIIITEQNKDETVNEWMLFSFKYRSVTHKLKLIHIPFEWMVVRRQDSGKVRAGPNRI